MTIDLVVLLAVGALSMLLAFLPGLSRIRRGGMEWGLGNREAPPPREPGWVGRAERAHRNLLENLPLFIIVVLVAHVTGAADEITGLACIVFLVARIAHAGFYVGGITLVRTLVFYIALGAELVIAWRIVA